MSTSKTGAYATAASLRSESDEKDALSTHLSRGSENLTDDPSRSTLHTGTAREGETQSRTIEDGAPIDSFERGAAQITPATDEPRGILASTTVTENAAGAAIGTLSIVDPDAGDSHEITLSDDRFEVVGNEIRLKDGVSLDHEETAEIDLEVTVTDAGGLTTSETFTIAVEDVNEAPAEVMLDGTTVTENAAGAAIGTLSIVDPDAGDSHEITLSDDRFE
ncbi:cadherin repeat domain-containing protein, partial [Tritonibacter multivorans]